MISLSFRITFFDFKVNFYIYPSINLNFYALLRSAPFFKVFFDFLVNF